MAEVSPVAGDVITFMMNSAWNSRSAALRQRVRMTTPARCSTR